MKLGNFSLSQSRSVVIATASVVSAAVLGIAGIGVSQAYHKVTIESDGVSRVIVGFYPDVQSALNAAGIEVGEYDEVTPEVVSVIDNGVTINVARANPYQIVVKGEPTVEWSSAVSLDAVFADLSVTGSPESIVVSRSESRDALPLFENETTTNVLVDTVPIAVRLKGGETVAEVLALAEVTLNPIDSLRLVSADGGIQLEVTTAKRGTVVTTQEIPFNQVEQEDSTLAKGTTEVRQEGAVGELTIKTYERWDGGELTLSVKESEAVTREPVDYIVAIGTKEPVVAKTTTSASTSGSSTATVATGDVWSKLAACESGGNPATNTGNGYYGLYQFSAGTWASVGGSGLPSDASASEQTARAQTLQARSGWGQWPGCASSLGLY